MPGQPESRRVARLWILDYIRTLLAAVVVLGHVGLPIPEIARSHAMARLIVNNLFNGPAAVIVFFVISGFCIHLPNIGKSRVDLLPYIARREIRIGAPVLVALLIMLLAKSKGSEPAELGVLWSLWCEEIYYLLYPGILWIRARRGWLLIWTGAIALFVACRLTTHNDVSRSFISPGWGKTWMLGLPCWLVGCNLAEFVVSGGLGRVKPISSLGIWSARIVILVTSWVIGVSRFHLSMSNMDLLPAFGFISVGWLLLELKRCEGREGSAPQAFQASYSLYLCHPLVGPLLAVAALGSSRGLTYAGIAILTAGFYLGVERPLHSAARRVGSRIAARTAAQVG